MPPVRSHPPPHSETELLQRAALIAGQTLEEVAADLQIETPTSFEHNKGWGGQLLETWLGASAGSRAEPDFPELGIELKTLPIDRDGRPLESTYVCTVDLRPATGNWQESVVWHKLKHVLWLPLVTQRGARPGGRRIGAALLWSPSTQQQEILRQDWEELMDLISAGEVERVSSRQGRYLQIRPKAANAKALTGASDVDGNRIATLPRGFYLRPTLTREILKEHYHL